MRARRLMACAAASALLAVGAAACEPPPLQLEIQISLHRGGLISEAEGGFRTVVLTGVSHCTREEPVDLFPTLTQGAVVDRPGETSVPCGPERREWTASFTVDDTIGPGQTRVDIEACTNPGDPIDEDCASLGRVVGLGLVR